MSAIDPGAEALLGRIRAHVADENIRLSQHAHEEMVEEDFTLEDILHAFASGKIAENYPEHRRGACCLFGGTTRQGRPLHVVGTTARPVVIVITVYKPKPPKWVSPTERGR